MSEESTTIHIGGGLFFVLFVAIKLAGHSLAAWSWWWMLLPIVPLVGLLIQRFGL